MSIGHGHPLTQRERDEWVADERFAARCAEFAALYPHTRAMGYLERSPMFYRWLVHGTPPPADEAVSAQ